jgi:hypothetical protein
LGQTLDSLFIETPEGLQINSVFQNWFVHPLIDAFNAADITGDGNLNQNDPSPLQFAKRSLRTPEFTVDFDADSCTESTRLGLLTASRSELEARETDVQDVESSQWQVIEGDLSYGIMQENQFNLAGRSYLVSNTGALGSLELPLCNEIGPECLPDWIYEYLWRPEELVGVGDPMGSSNPDWLTLDHAASVGLTAWIKTHGNQTGYDLRTMYFFELQRMPESMDLLEVLSYLD